MPNLKLSYVQRPLVKGESVLGIFERVRERSAFLLQSSSGGRYSYVGYDPFAKVWSRNGVTQLVKLRDFADWKKSGSVQMFEGEPFRVLRDLTKHFQINTASPLPFSCGVAGYLSYDFGVKMAGIEQKVFDDLELPDFDFFFVDKVFVVDHETSELYFMAVGATNSESERKLEIMENDLRSLPGVVSSGTVGKIVSNLSFEQYEQKFGVIRRHLEQGDTYQVNFSQRFFGDCTRDAWEIYRILSVKNPAPYSCFFDFDDFQIVSSSPELLLSKSGSKLVTKPIKGTSARGKNVREDQKNIERMLASPKEAAELAMIVDLERNDLGKVCKPGSVRVIAHRDVEKYARVIHTVSTVEGTILQNKDFFDALGAVFPGGSITGCPKKRTMEIIDELEDFRRGIYTGSAGVVGFDGNGVMNILIRTMLLRNGKLYYQAGGGIVIDSDVRAEYEETFQKARALEEVIKKS